MQKAIGATILLWAVGTLMSEALQQAALLAAVVLSVFSWRRVALPHDVRPVALAAGAFALWQLVSPLIALATGAAQALPRMSRYGQALDTVATVSLVAVASLGPVPWRALRYLLGGGWLLSVGLGLFQHFVPWPWANLGVVHVDLQRMHSNFAADGTPRYAAAGFFFHRLRFAHGAVAFLGPLLATLARATQRRVKAGAAVLVGALLVGLYASYARAALAAALLIVGVAVVFFLRGWRRWAGVGLVACVVLAAALSPAWRERFARVSHNAVGEERALAMSVGWELARTHPLLGVGFGNHKPAALATQPRTGIPPLLATDSHNLWLTIWAETGIVGVLLALAFYLALLRALLGRARQGSILAMGGLLSWIAFQILGLVHYLPYHTGVMLSFAFFWGLGLVPLERQPREEAPAADGVTG